MPSPRPCADWELVWCPVKCCALCSIIVRDLYENKKERVHVLGSGYVRANCEFGCCFLLCHRFRTRPWISSKMSVSDPVPYS